MKLLLATTLVLMLSAVALAAPETRQLGPYTVSFDLNTNLNYQVQTSDPMDTGSATVYGMRILTDNSTGAGVNIIENKELTDSTTSMIKLLINYGLAFSGINTTNIVDQTIDGKNGFVAIGVPFAGQSNAPSQLYRAIYWLDSVDCTTCGPVSVGKTSVDISSTYPQDVTQNLLNSIHVAKS